ncbi:ABC transporter substrate-binding protein [Streptomyces sp. H10-C2]|uniref:ABC transporter substrate-binding protein n=1 Tax=unclassified Streptomyces TaxID=2593676 RepID=UPI0024B985ED|nr:MULTISPECIES: ABC transporter substrate-binding protein [unclassified Streptomyces]MDJ0343799.1 ABC transporter substrate-binding protein [Streptomyces sp. PH10-H1]MDJ0373320.1 ABC transporter substrate-binding protein [Streptomyces sp. H10-C2]
MNRKLLVLPALLGVLAPGLAACGGSDSGGANSGKPIVVGTTDSITLTKDNPAPLDPATSYDSATWNVFYNTFQMLLRYPRSGTNPEPDAAEKCGFTDQRGQVYQCTLRKGLTFSNGHALTAEDVKFSVERMLAINSDNGPASLIAGVSTVQAPDDHTVIFQLKAPDTTFPLKLATPAAAILDSHVYAKDKPFEGFKIVGSGPYTLDDFKQGDRAVFSRNANYQGTLKLNNSKVELRMFSSADTMESELKSGTVDVATRTMRPDQINRLLKGGTKDVKLTEAAGTEARYLFFDTTDAAVRPKAVRQAIAQIMDRQTLTRDVFQRTAEPLYSPVPVGITGHANSFFKAYGDPNTAKAKALLHAAGIDGKVAFDYWYRKDLAGSSNKEEAEAIKRQLDASGLFDVTLKSEQWNVFLTQVKKHKYAAYALSWLPDFPDPDNYIAPFFDRDNFLKLPYQSDVIQRQVIPETRQQSQRSATISDFENAQKIIAQDVPMLPLWQGKQYIAARSDITGVEWALNSSTTTQFWELGRGVTG